MTADPLRVVVVGAGIAGLAAACELRGAAPAGTEVVVLEAAPRIGGKLRTSEVAGVPVDEGAESFLARRPEGVALAAEVGLADDLAAPGTLGAGVWSRGAVRPLPARTVLGVPADLRALAATGVVSPAAVARAALDLALPRTPPGDDVAVGRYVGRRLGREVVDRLVDPLLGGVYAGRADALSLAATVPELARTARAHRSLLRAAAAAIPPRPAAGPVFLTATAGMATLAAATAAASGATVRTGCTVRGLTRTARGWRLVVGPTRDPETVDADAIVLAVPAAPAARLLAADVPLAAADLGGIDYASVAIVTLAFREPVPVAGSGFLVPAVEGRLVKAVTAASAKWPHLGTNLAIVRCSIGRYGESGDLQRDDADLVRGTLADLAATTGLRAAPVDTRVSRWGGALPQYGVGHLDRVARIEAAVSLQPRLAVCGAAYDGVGVPACIGSGRRAGRVIGAALSRPRPR